MALPGIDVHYSPMNRVQEERVAGLAAVQHGLVTRAQLRAAGLSAEAVDRMVATGRLRPVHRGVYLVGPLPGSRAREMGAVLAIGRGARASHDSAAWLWGVVPGRDPSSPVDLVVLGGGATSRPGIRLHRVRRLPADECATVDRVPVTSVARTLLDLATRVGRRDLEQAIARAEQERLVTLDDLASLAARYPHRPGTPALRALLDDGAEPALTESQAEEAFLTLAREAELPHPKVNTAVGPYRLDFYWPDHQIAVEVDGFRHHGVRPRFEGDRQRAARLAAMGIQVIPLTWRQLTGQRVATAVRIGKALALAERG
jgi:very-short-patch-repair endonuclease/predicted transcriptional regulator of viral defense system